MLWGELITVIIVRITNFNRKRNLVLMTTDKTKRGYTLVEMIVTLVVVAVLAAIIVPVCLQWADKAKEQRLLMEVKLVKSALDVYVAELYAVKEDEDWVFDVYETAGAIHDDFNPIHEYLCDSSGKDAEIKEIALSITSNSVISFVYHSGDYDVIYDNGEIKVKK